MGHWLADVHSDGVAPAFTLSVRIALIDIRKKLSYINTFAIENVLNGKRYSGTGCQLSR